MPDDPVTQEIRRMLARSEWRQQLESDYQSTAGRLTKAYERALRVMRPAGDDLSDYLKDYADANDGSIPPRATVQNNAAYANLTDTVQTQMDNYASVLENEAFRLAEIAGNLGIIAATELTEQMSGDAAPEIMVGWNKPSPESIAAAYGYVTNPVFVDRLRRFGQEAADNVGSVVLAGIARGKSPLFIAQLITKWFTIPYSWAENMARTIQLWSYRQGSHETYRRNARVLDGWMWWSARDVRTCPACIANHGTVYPLSATLNDHHRGRCTPLPVVKGSTWQNTVQTGPDWFAGLPEADQVAIMGRGRLDGLRAGLFSWSDMGRNRNDALYGPMWSMKPLKDLVG